MIILNILLAFVLLGVIGFLGLMAGVSLIAFIDGSNRTRGLIARNRIERVRKQHEATKEAPVPEIANPYNKEE